MLIQTGPDGGRTKNERQERQQAKAQRRARREIELAARIAALPEQRYGVILADPPWRFEPYSRETGMDRAAENHYPTCATDAIAALPVNSIAAPDCVLFLWATVPMLEHALRVMKAWGFTYKSQLVWVKDRIGLGYWARNKHELLLIGARGKIPAPAPGSQWSSVIEAPVGEHSVKPHDFREMIEVYFPHLPKVELYCRGKPAEGWDGWGAEVEPAVRPRGIVPASEADLRKLRTTGDGYRALGFVRPRDEELLSSR